MLLEKPWPDFGSTATPLPPVPGISPTGSSVSRLKTVMRPGDGRHGRRRVGRRRATLTAARDVQPASGDVGIDVVAAAFAADPGGLQHFVRTRTRRLRGTTRDGHAHGNRDEEDAFHAVVIHRSAFISVSCFDPRPLEVEAEQRDDCGDVHGAVNLEAHPARLRHDVVRLRSSLGDELLADADRERQVGEMAAVQVTELASPDEELDAAEPMRLDRDAFPSGDFRA